MRPAMSPQLPQPAAARRLIDPLAAYPDRYRVMPYEPLLPCTSKSAGNGEHLWRQSYSSLEEVTHEASRRLQCLLRQPSVLSPPLNAEQDATGPQNGGGGRLGRAHVGGDWCHGAGKLTIGDKGKVARRLWVSAGSRSAEGSIPVTSNAETPPVGKKNWSPASSVVERPR